MKKAAKALPAIDFMSEELKNNWGGILKRVIISLAILVFLQNIVVFLGGIRFPPLRNLENQS